MGADLGRLSRFLTRRYHTTLLMNGCKCAKFKQKHISIMYPRKPS